MEGRTAGGRMTDFEIMERLQDAASGCDAKLTYAHKLFFLKLLAYADGRGESCVGCTEGIRFSMSVREFSDRLSVPQRTVMQALRALEDCGIILRRAGRKAFPRGRSITVIKKGYYEKQEGKSNDKL